MPNDDTITGLKRRRATRGSVVLADRAARVMITVGGIGTILAVTLILVFLVWVVLFLFKGATIRSEGAVPLASPKGEDSVLQIRVDEHRTLVWALRASGRLQTILLETGEVLADVDVFAGTGLAGRSPTAATFPPGTPDVAFGFDDGSYVIGEIVFRSKFLNDRQISSDLESAPDTRRHEVLDLPIGPAVSYEHVEHKGRRSEVRRSGVVQKTPEGQYRFKWVETDLRKPVEIEPPAPVLRIDLAVEVRGEEKTRRIAALTEDRRIVVNEVREKKNLMTGETTLLVSGGAFPLGAPGRPDMPAFLCLAELGSYVYAAWADGDVIRFNTRNPEKVVRAERIDLLPEDGVVLTRLEFLLGKYTLLAGDSTGRVRCWWPASPEGRAAQTADGRELVLGHTLPATGSPVSALFSSKRQRLLLVGHDDGRIRYFFVTSENLVIERQLPGGRPIEALALSVRDDGIAAVCGGDLWQCDLESPHPDISFEALFTPLRYEGYWGRKHVWQSTGLTDSFEPKLSLVVLVFGTLKATLYSMLFGLPIALLAAVFTSEFLHPRVKAMIKPTIEVMASLPSVVLGFLAALVIAPFVDKLVPAVLTSFFTIPFAFLLGAHLWQLLSQGTAARMSRHRLPFICLCLPLGILLAAWLGPSVERWLFAGDLKLWLDGTVGEAWGGWMLVLLPLSVVVVAVVVYWVMGPWFRGATAGLGRRACGGVDLLRFGSTLVVGLLVAYLLSERLGAWGLDPRGSVVDTYIPRNAMVVGFVMGFAIIPIIFTISEDALSAVPEHLRSASLGAGATPWQTAARIVIPTAMSGLFSAVMIGLGRAVGETMIVLMAAGNTPIMEWNIFNGFRTLSANLAVELPEAVKDSTHYRTLFLAALVLFVITFVLNTVAEAIRIRFRKRAYQL